MKRTKNLLFTNKYHAISYVLNNLKNNYGKVVLPSIIGKRENNIFSNFFTELYYYDFVDYSPDYENINELIDKNSLLVLRDIYPCGAKNIANIFDRCGLTIKENIYIFDNDSYHLKNVINMDNLNLFYRSPQSDRRTYREHKEFRFPTIGSIFGKQNKRSLYEIVE